MSETFELLQDWYFSQCNGDWEHEFGIKIDTLDNPGWIVKIDLLDTKYKNYPFIEVDQEIDEFNWIQCNVVDGRFTGAGGPKNLKDIIDKFLQWTQSLENK